MTGRTGRRWLARAALCIALGLATTVAVAWALAAWLPHRSLTLEVEHIPEQIRAGSTGSGDGYPVHRFLHGEEVRRPGMARRAWASRTGNSLALPLLAREHDSEVVRFVRIPGAVRLRRDWGTHPLTPGGSWGCEDARGWPWLALWCVLADDPAPAPDASLSGGIALPAGRGNPFPMADRSLPLRPIWAGLVADTGVYAVMWGLLLATPGWLRRARRRAKGRCAGCGYDRAGLAPDARCPECGEPQRGERGL